MREIDELLQELSKIKIAQSSGDWEEDIPFEIWDKYFKGNLIKVEDKIDIDTHRWYETSMTVYKIFDSFLGVRHINNIFSESMDNEDCSVELQFFKIKEVPGVRYWIDR